MSDYASELRNKFYQLSDMNNYSNNFRVFLSSNLSSFIYQRDRIPDKIKQGEYILENWLVGICKFAAENNAESCSLTVTEEPSLHWKIKFPNDISFYIEVFIDNSGYDCFFQGFNGGHVTTTDNFFIKGLSESSIDYYLSHYKVN